MMEAGDYLIADMWEQIYNFEKQKYVNTQYTRYRKPIEQDDPAAASAANIAFNMELKRKETQRNMIMKKFKVDAAKADEMMNKKVNISATQPLRKRDGKEEEKNAIVINKIVKNMDEM